MMCRSDSDRQAQLVSYGGMKNVLSDPSASPFGALNPAVSTVNPAALAEYQRLQLYDYAQAAAASRLRFAATHPAFTLPSPYGLASFPSMNDGQGGLSTYGFPSPFVRFDPRARFVQEEPKPQHSYIGLIAMAILSIPDKKMVLSDIYQYILDQYPYFRNRGPGWRNSIRHNLSLNDCFIKAGRSANGKGHYWAIHPANVEDFKKGDFRRRKAQRKVRKHMGLSVPDDDDSPNPTPPPPQAVQSTSDGPSIEQDLGVVLCSSHSPTKMLSTPTAMLTTGGMMPGKISMITMNSRQKRQFDMESLLAPDPVQVPSPRFSPHIEIDSESPRLECGRSFTTSPCSDSAETNGIASLMKELNRESTNKDGHDNNQVSSTQNSEKELISSRPVVPTSSGAAMRRAMQWTMSLPLQNMGIHQRTPFGTVAGLPFAVSSPCWSQAQAASLLTYSVSAANTSGLRTADLSVVSNPCSTPISNPLVHRWQETINRVVFDTDNGQKVVNQ